ncbi:PIN domain-containing protein, partial [Virgibacillus sp. 6R]|uniref:PIN domain-containing protein n=1 Tax=Metabacillus sp. 22489 TaxID=3453928 RepID=UPI001643234B
MDTNTALCLDTNILLNLFEPGTHDTTTFNKFLTAVITYECHLIITDQVLLEWKRHVNKTQNDFIDNSQKTIEEYKSLIRFLDTEEEKMEMEKTLEKIKRMEIRKYKYNYGKRAEKINNLLDDPNYTKIVKRSQKAEQLIVEKSIKKEAPFFYNEFSQNKNHLKNESADASIFFTLYDHIKNGTINYEKIYFITDNKKDFSDPSNPAKIHENLKPFSDEVSLIFSNNLKEILNSLITRDEGILNLFGSEESMNQFLIDKYFTKCPKCFEEVHINGECNINCVSKECVRFLTHTVFYLIE